MFYQWLLISLSCLGSAQLQYITTGGPGASAMDPLELTLQYPLPYVQYFNLPSSRNNKHNKNFMEQFSPKILINRLRSSRDIEGQTKHSKSTNLPDKDKAIYLSRREITPIVVEVEESKDNATSILEATDKNYFSPWGGKKDSNIQQTWTWKRGSTAREPSMPKRVRFSPWGGKRSGQMIMKPGETRGSKIIFYTTIPALTRIVSTYLPMDQLNIASYQFIHSLGKRHPIKILSLSTKLNERTLRDAMPYNIFVDSLPKIFKPGHPYVDVNLNKDGKRKVKFSAWGGKRFPPVIGPIWKPVPRDATDSNVNTVLLIRNQDRKVL